MISIDEQVTTRDLILDACDRIMARYGFRKMTVEDLAKEARVSRRTIYIHFAGKEDVGLSSIARVVENVHSELVAIAKSELEPVEKLRHVLTRRVIGRIEKIKDYSWSLDELFEAVRPAYMSRRRHFFEVETQLLAEILLEGQEVGDFSLGQPEAFARTLLLATNCFLPYSLSVKELGEPFQIANQLSEMIELLLQGLQSHATERKKP